MKPIHAATLTALCLAALLTAATAQGQSCVSSYGQTVAQFCPMVTEWPAGTLFISTDDGGHWHNHEVQVLDASTSATGVYAITNEGGPRLLVVGDRITDFNIPLDGALSVEAFGNDVYVAGWRGPDDHTRVTAVVRMNLADSTWHDVDSVAAFSWQAELSVFAGRERPSIQLVLSYGLECWGVIRVRRYSFDGTRFRGADLLNDESCAETGRQCSGVDDIYLGAFGAAYAFENVAGSARMFLTGPGERREPTGIRTASVAEPRFVSHNRRITLAVIGSRLMQLSGTRHRVLSASVPESPFDLHVDSRGRAWVATSGGIHRYSRRSGWRQVFGL